MVLTDNGTIEEMIDKREEMSSSEQFPSFWKFQTSWRKWRLWWQKERWPEGFPSRREKWVLPWQASTTPQRDNLRQDLHPAGRNINPQEDFRPGGHRRNGYFNPNMRDNYRVKNKAKGNGHPNRSQVNSIIYYYHIVIIHAMVAFEINYSNHNTCN